MNASGIFAFVAAYSIQVLLVLGLGIPLPRILGLKGPGFKLRYYGFLLGTILLLPALGTVSFRSEALPASPALHFQLIVTNSIVGSGDSHIFPGLLLVLGGVVLIRLATLVVGLAQLRMFSRSVPLLRPISPAIALHRDRLVRNATIAVTNRFSVPVSFGWRRPYILVPTGFSDLDAASQEAIICHELLHLKRGDWLVTIAEQVVKAVFWFHPAVHLLLDQIDLTREQLIDREVIRITGRPRVYLETLKQTAETFRRASVAPMIPFIRASHLKERVVSLKQEVCMSKTRLIVLSSVLFASLVALSAAAIATVPLTGSAFPGRAAGDPGLENSAPNPLPASNQEEQKRGEKNKEGQVSVSDEVDVRVKLIKKVNPVYPEEAKKQGITGTVVCNIRIAESGKVTEVKVTETPHELLSKAAADAVGQWEYEPPTKNGKSVSVQADVTIRFRLE
jgi:TonB family protein